MYSDINHHHHQSDQDLNCYDAEFLAVHKPLLSSILFHANRRLYIIRGQNVPKRYFYKSRVACWTYMLLFTSPQNVQFNTIEAVHFRLPVSPINRLQNVAPPLIKFTPHKTLRSESQRTIVKLPHYCLSKFCGLNLKCSLSKNYS